MKQIEQNYRSGELRVADVPTPRTGAGSILVSTRVSLISAGTEKQAMDLAKSSLAGKAMARPDLVRRVWSNVKRDGLKPTMEKVFAKLDTPIPLGYSLVGEVLELGSKVSGHAVRERVACAGAGFANHAEYNVVPKNLTVAVPENVDDEEASFVTLGAIALQGVRVAAPTIGETIVVMGLGLIGLLTVQILKANGCRVIGFDPNASRVALAQKLGANVAVASALPDVVASFTGGYGADAVIVTASSKSSEPINMAAEISRMKGRIVVVGLVGMTIDRDPFYKRELELKLSLSYGPGRHDPSYELAGNDYPLPYVRWTEQRNMDAFLRLVAEGRVTPKALVTHRFAIGEAEKAYALMDSGEPHLAILLTYPDETRSPVERQFARSQKTATKAGLGVAFVGLGNYAKGMLLPAVRKTPDVTLTTVVTSTGLSADHSAGKFDFAIAATDPAAAFNDPATDVVFVATRHDTHAQISADALRAGKHVFCEKPLAIDSEGLADVLGAAASTQGVLTVGFNRRFAPMIEKAKAALNPRSGPLVMLYRVNAGTIPGDSWVQGAEGGGRIVGEVCHFIDTMVALCGAEPVEAQAVNARGLADSVSILLRFADGSTGTIVYASIGDPSVPKEYLEVFATGSVIRLDDFVKLTITRGGKDEVIKGKQDKGQTALVAAFLAAARSGGEPPIPLSQLKAVTEATIAIENSLRSGGPEEIDGAH